MAFRMKWTALAVLAVSALAGGVSAAQESEPQSIVVTGQRATSPWVRAESDHVVVVSNAARADVARLVEHIERLDALLRVYTADYGAVGAGPEPKLNLIYLDDNRELDRVTPDRPSGSIGLFRDCAGGVQGFLVHTSPLTPVTDDRLATAPLHEGLFYASQAYARHFLYRHTDVRAPSAWIEGFSSYFGGVMFGTKQMVIGRTPPGIGRYFAFRDEGHPYNLDYSDMLGPDPYKNLGNTRAQSARVEYQARAWILAHYILGASERRQRLGTFLNTIHNGADPAVALRDAFGLDVDKASTDLWRYRLQAAKVLRVDMPFKVRPEVTFKTMSATSGEFVLADTVLKACPARAQGETLLRTLTTDAAKVPNVDAGQLALSRARVDWGDPAAALPWLQKAARRADASADALVLLARANLKLAAPADAGARASYLEAARTSLTRARKREPGLGAIALAELDLSLLADGAPSRAALDGVIAAWRTTRDSGPLARAAVLAWCYLVDAPKAEHVLRMLENDTRDPAMTAWAADFHRRLDAGLTLAAIQAEMRKGLDGALAADGANEWTLDLVGVMKEVEAQAGLEYARQAMQQQMQTQMQQQMQTPSIPSQPPSSR
ncbi:MAG: hypothetical protein JF619_16175 [Massilia sp.]|nr:hypothetical protein [Massilia sp.]